MTSNMRYFFLFFLCLPLITVAKPLELVVGLNKPPYVISEKNSGFELELAREIFAELGHEISPIYVPFGRTARLVKTGNVAIGLTLKPQHDIDSTLLTNQYVFYQNVVVTRTDRHLKIDKVEDLLGKSVIAFQTARTVLGEEFANTLAQHSSYMEMAQQERQVNMLLRGSVDAIVLDRNIFRFIKSTFSEEEQCETTIHELFPISAYQAAIPDPELRADFNETLALFFENGRYQALINKFNLDNLADRVYKSTVMPTQNHASEE